ncbi:hypothetical protein ADUPG1_010595, partial [Aduncisulcus paluster]
MSQKKHNVADFSSGEAFSSVPSPEEQSNIISQLSFSYLTSLTKIAVDRPIEYDDLHPLRESFRSKTLINNVEESWKKQESKAKEKNDHALLKGKQGKIEKPSILFALWDSFKSSLVFSFFQKLIHDIILFFKPYAIKSMVSIITDIHSGNNTRRTYILAGILVLLIFILPFIQTVALQSYFRNTFNLSFTVKSSLSGLIFKKLLRISETVRQRASSGNIVNLMFTDSQYMGNLALQLHQFWSMPFQLVVGIVLLLINLGIPALAGIGVIVLFIPIQSVVTNKLARHTRDMMKKNDERVRTVNEVLSGIRMIKSSGYETEMIEKISKSREIQSKVLYKVQLYKQLQVFMMDISPILVCGVSFLMYALIEGNTLSPDVAFASVSLFDILWFPIMFVPRIISISVEARTASSRMAVFMELEEVEKGVKREKISKGRSSDPKHSLSTTDSADSSIVSTGGSSSGRQEIVTIGSGCGDASGSLCFARLDDRSDPSRVFVN